MEKISTCSNCTDERKSICMSEMMTAGSSIRTLTEIGMDNILNSPETFDQSADSVREIIDSTVEYLRTQGCTNSLDVVAANLNSFTREISSGD